MKLIAVAAAALSLAQPGDAGATFGFYTSALDVSEHRKIDLDVKAFQGLTGRQMWEEAEALYRNGANSAKSNSLRTLAGFSTELRAQSESIQTDKANGRLLPELELFSNYYGSDTYAHEFVIAALNASGPFTGHGNIARDQHAKKGVQYQVVVMYIFYEMAKSLSLCFRGEDGRKNWDEAAAFYVGSLIGPTGEGSGELMYTLSEKRCGTFGTCGGDGVRRPFADTNNAAMKAFTEGLAAITSGNCEAASESYQIVRKQMQIPLLQGMLLYAFNAAAVNGGAGNEKYMSEGWAFAASVLPFLDEQDKEAAREIRLAMEYTTGINATVTGGFESVFTNTYKVLPKLCISCEEMGVNNFALGKVPECISNAEALKSGCASYLAPVLANAGSGSETDPESSSNTGLIVGLCILGLVLIGAILFCMYRLSKPSSTDRQVEMEHSSNEEERNAAGKNAAQAVERV